VTIPSIDVARSVEFYTRLGLILIVESSPRYARFICPDGDATFSIHRVEHLSAGERPIVYFECDDLDDTVLALKEKGIQFDSEPVDQTWLWREAYLRDPDGNRICIYFAGENRVNPPWRQRSSE